MDIILYKPLILQISFHKKIFSSFVNSLEKLRSNVILNSNKKAVLGALFHYFSDKILFSMHLDDFLRLFLFSTLRHLQILLLQTMA